jgi:hypothetical protein
MLDIKVSDEFSNWNTHNWIRSDYFKNPNNKYKDYVCKICGCLLLDAWEENGYATYYSIGGPDILKAKQFINNYTCKEMLLKNVL